MIAGVWEGNAGGTPSAALRTALGKSRCGLRCVNLKRNENHCGECFNRCAAGQECVDGVCGGEVCPGELLTPVGGGDPICTCSGSCVASCDACPSGTICTIGPSECGNPPTLACSGL